MFIYTINMSISTLEQQKSINIPLPINESEENKNLTINISEFYKIWTPIKINGKIS
jgi:hypothetical protein